MAFTGLKTKFNETETFLILPFSEDEVVLKIVSNNSGNASKSYDERFPRYYKSEKRRN